jgi:hypothetical protein
MIRSICAAALVGVLAIQPGHAAEDTATPIHHSIEARLDPDSGNLEVTDIVTVRGRDALVFRLAPWLEIEAITLDGRPVEVAGNGGVRRIALPDTGAHRVALRLRGTVPPLPKEGRRGVTPSAVSGPEGSYLSGYAGWIPVTDDDWTAYRLSVEVPAPHRAVATGRLEEEALGDKVNRAVFAADFPAELPALFAGPYTVRERQENGIRIRTWFHAELSNLSDDYLRDSGRFLLRYHEEIGPYPFPDFHVISSPLPVGLGFPNLTYIGRSVLPLPFIRGRSLAHEVLHNWWGNGVVADHATGNWAEGLTTYMADYALAAEAGPGRAQEMRLAWPRDAPCLAARLRGPAGRARRPGHRLRRQAPRCRAGGRLRQGRVHLPHAAAGAGRRGVPRGSAAVLARAALPYRRLGRPPRGLRGGIGTRPRLVLRAMAGPDRRPAPQPRQSAGVGRG